MGHPTSVTVEIGRGPRPICRGMLPPHAPRLNAVRPRSVGESIQGVTRMPQMTANDFHPEVLKLFDKYVHGLIDRRGFLDGAAKFTGTIGAAATLDLLRPNYAEAQQVPPDDKRLKIERAEYQSPMGYGSVKGLLARPA